MMHATCMSSEKEAALGLYCTSVRCEAPWSQQQLEYE